MTTEEYASLFATASDRRLIDTIDHPHESDPLAVEAAKREFLKRGLDEATVSGLRAERTAIETKQAMRKAQADTLVQRVGSEAAEIAQTFIGEADPTKADKRHVRVLIIAMLVVLIAIAPRFLELQFIAEYGLDWSMVEHFLPLILLPLTIVLLWKRRRAGWFLGAATTAYIFIGTAASGYWSWGREPSGLFALDGLIDFPTQSEIVARVLTTAGLTVAFHVHRSLAIYRITERERWITVLPVVGFAWWLWS